MMTSAMAMPIDVIPALHFFGYTTTTSLTDHDDHRCNWNNWSPLVNWDSFTAGQDDFHDLIESMMDPDNSIALEEEGSTSTTTSTEVNMVDLEENNFKVLRLVHLLMAAAEALNKSRDLARLILVRLKELVSPTDGTNMERLAAYFTDALQGLLEGEAGGGCGEHNKHFTSNRVEYHHHHTDMLAAFQLLQDMCPYVKFGHFTANQAILEAVAHDGRVHIVDYDIMEGIQWASFMEALASRKDGPPAPHLRITALSRGGSGSSSGRGHGSIATVQETGRRLTEFAASMGQPFSFHQCRLDSDGTFLPSSLKLVRGEALVFNCVLNLPHQSYRSPDSVESFLNGAKTLNPRLVTLVEEEAGTTGDVGFVGRFMDSLHHYSAVYDSLEYGFPMQNRARTLVERVFLGPRIAASLAGIYRTGREEERGWCGEWLRGNGFKGVSISFGNHCQAKLLAGLFNDGYRVEGLGSNKLVLGWKSRRLLSASVWSSSSSSDTNAQT